MTRAGRVQAWAREAWAGYAGEQAAFVDGQVQVLVNPDSRLCPSGWVGVVRIGDAVVATAPDEASAEQVRAVVGGLPPQAVVNDDIARVLGARDALGPTWLFFGEQDPSKLDAGGRVDEVLSGSQQIRRLHQACSPDDVAEVALDELDSSVFAVVDDAGDVLSGCGYDHWPGDLAHMSVLTHPAHRGRGLAKQVASAAVADASSRGLIIQWRARPEASQRLALSLGLERMGQQISVRLG